MATFDLAKPAPEGVIFRRHGAFLACAKTGAAANSFTDQCNRFLA